jgi:uncharacterized protein YndB with AHSA1/START domain
MAEYEASRVMPADSDVVFAVVSDLESANRWLPAEIHVHDQGEPVVEADGERFGSDPPHEGLYRVSPEQLRLEWTGRDDPDYAGWLQVSDRAGGGSEVTLHLSFLGKQPEARPSQHDRTQRMLESSLDRLAEEVGARA